VWVVEHRARWLDPFFVALSVVGFAGLVWVVLAPALAIWNRRAVLATTVLVAAGVWASDLIATGLKSLFDRPRPYERLAEADPILGGTVGASFPSGHAATSFAGAILLTVLVRRAVPLLFVLAVLISFSRVYVGVHYPLDLVGGALLGSAVALALVGAVRALRRPSGARRQSAAAPPPG
jgi:undecaprenyl-diphosphatase